MQPKCGQVCKFVKNFRSYLLGVRTARIEVPCKLVEVAAYLAALGKQSGNSGQGFFSAAGNDDRFLDFDVVDKSIICFLSDKSSHPCNAILHLYCCSSVICILMYFCSQNIGYKPDILTANRPLTVTLFRPALEPGLLCVLAGFPSAFFVVSRNF